MSTEHSIEKLHFDPAHDVMVNLPLPADMEPGSSVTIGPCNRPTEVTIYDAGIGKTILQPNETAVFRVEMVKLEDGTEYAAWKRV